MDFDLDQPAPAANTAAPAAPASLYEPKRPRSLGHDALGKALVSAKAITAAQLDAALTVAQRTPGSRLIDLLLAAGADAVAVQTAAGQFFGVPFHAIDDDQLQSLHKPVHRVGLDFCVDKQVLPLRPDGSRFLVGIVHPQDMITLDHVRHKLGQSIKPVLITPADVTRVVESLRDDDPPDDELAVEDIIADIDEDDVEVVEAKEEDLDLEKMAGESPVIRYVNYLIYDAVKQGASDIHIEPQEKKLQVRYRIDGVLFDAMNPPAHMKAAIVSRLKIMGNLDISERRLPQDGRIRAMVHGRKLDLRMSTLPMVQGEKVVLRILDTRSIQVDLDDLGMSDDMLSIWKNQIKNPHGIILVTGPTGSGKTTTLYSSLGQMDRGKLNISTVEDPVEYHLSGINQTQVRDDIGMSFAAALRALLRQDPDVVMVGEIRDQETAKTAIQASLTGHLVLSTLHTNDAPSSVTRLINIGVEPYLIGSAVNACVAQRLVRKICPHCAEQTPPDPKIADHLAMHGIAPDQVYMGKGCDKCRNTGYSGRIGLYEMLIMNDQLRDRIASNPNVTEFRRMCIEGGMTTLREDGFAKVAAGQTTVEEVLRVTEATI
ncbi:MAG: GspE/PulE family protein [Planctomycetota bacterium]